jgi:hypothetical protein
LTPQIINADRVLSVHAKLFFDFAAQADMCNTAVVIAR